MSRGRSLLRLLLPSLILVAGCSSVAQTSAPVQETEPEVFIPTEAAKPRERLRFELTLNLSDPTELRIKEGDTITKGQVLSERTPSQQQLFNRAKLQTQLAEKKSFLEEDQLRAALAELESTRKLLTSFDEASPYNSGIDPALIPISRTLERNRLEAKVQEAAAAVEAIKVRVQEARRQAVSEQNQLLAQLKVIDAELEKLKVRSPYNGIVRRLKVERGTNNELIAKLKIQSSDGKSGKTNKEEVSRVPDELEEVD